MGDMTDYKLVPVAWVTADTVDGQTVNGKPRRIWWENNDGVGMPIYASPLPEPDVSILVEALELISDTDPNDGTAWFHEVAYKALATYRKGEKS